MATSVNTPTTDVSTVNALDIKPENQDYRVYVKLDNDGKKVIDVKYGTSGKDGAFWTKMEERVDPNDPNSPTKSGFVLSAEQTVKTYRVGTIKGFLELMAGDEDEAVAIINRGIVSKFGQKIGAMFTELNDDESNIKFDPIVGAFDSIELLREPTQRKNLSPIEKSMASLRKTIAALYPGLPAAEYEEKVRAFLSTFQS